MGAPKLLAAVSLIAVTAFFILPTSIQLAFGSDLPPYIYAILAFALGAPTAGFVGYEMWHTLGENRRIRLARKKLEAIDEQTYGCIQPQVLDSFVVFPVRVNKRDCVSSSWVELGNEAVVVNLCAAVKLTGAPDTEGPLRRLCDATLRRDLEVIVYCGGGTAGPTGLSVGVGRKGFGPFLASSVAHSIREAIRLGVTGQ